MIDTLTLGQLRKFLAQLNSFSDDTPVLLDNRITEYADVLDVEALRMAKITTSDGPMPIILLALSTDREAYEFEEVPSATQP